MSSHAPTRLESAVERRYAALAETDDSLSCGAALDLAGPSAGEVVVDLGCGRGRDVIRAATLVGDSGAAIGVDRSEAMIDKARTSVPADATNVRFVCCDLTSLPIENATANVVVSNCAINHVRDKAAVYREIRRVLRPGGRFVVSDIVAEHELPESVRNDPDAWAACYGGAVPEADYVALIRDAGFGTIQALRRTAPYERGGVMIRSLTIRGYR